MAKKQPAKIMKKKDRRAHLIDSAFRLSVLNGAATITWKQVADESDVSFQLVRHYFGTKDVLVKEILKHSAKVCSKP